MVVAGSVATWREPSQGGLREMREHRGKSNVSASDRLIQGILREEISGDVFELWIGISRLMARVCGPHWQAETGIRAAKKSLAKKSPATRRMPRRRAA